MALSKSCCLELNLSLFLFSSSSLVFPLLSTLMTYPFSRWKQPLWAIQLGSLAYGPSMTWFFVTGLGSHVALRARFFALLFWRHAYCCLCWRDRSWWWNWNSLLFHWQVIHASHKKILDPSPHTDWLTTIANHNHNGSPVHTLPALSWGCWWRLSLMFWWVSLQRHAPVTNFSPSTFL